MTKNVKNGFKTELSYDESQLITSHYLQMKLYIYIVTLIGTIVGAKALIKMITHQN